MGRLALLAAILCVGPAFAAPASIFGRWVVDGGEAVIRLAPCGEAACGRLVWLREPLNGEGAPKRDVENPDPALRDRPQCGLRLITGLERAGDGSWKGGTIYSTRDGHSYGIKVTPDGPDRLIVRGYLGISLFGQTQTWTRDNGDRGNCAGMTDQNTGN